MAEGGASPPRQFSSVVYSRLGDSEDEIYAAEAAGVYHEYWHDSGRRHWTDHGSDWEDECRARSGLEQLLERDHSPITGYRRFGPEVPRLRVGAVISRPRLEKTPEDRLSERPRWVSTVAGLCAKLLCR